MSILIKGMEMPKSCADCPLFESKYHFHGCHAKPESFNDMDMWNFVGDRPSWCPLIELPPHGRLIDADDIERITVKFEKIPLSNDWVLSSIDAPTIIEADSTQHNDSNALDVLESEEEDG